MANSGRVPGIRRGMGNRCGDNGLGRVEDLVLGHFHDCSTTNTTCPTITLSRSPRVLSPSQSSRVLGWSANLPVLSNVAQRPLHSVLKHLILRFCLGRHTGVASRFTLLLTAPCHRDR